MDSVALADVGRQLRNWAKTGGTFVTYPKPILNEMAESGVSDIDILNVLRTGAISEETGNSEFRVEGRLDDGTPISLHIKLDQVPDRKFNRQANRVRIEKITWPHGKSPRKQASAKKGKVEIERKLRRVQ